MSAIALAGTSPDGRILLSGTEALVSLMLRQRALDRAAGLDTAGFVSGYRGSPLGGVDLAMWRSRGALEKADIRFVPGLNEELAATAVWGTQQYQRFGAPRRAGVFALWYGKNPGLDRIGDVLKHANMDGTAALGGVLVATGDDPGASSSTIANQGEQAFVAAMSPVLYPCDVADLLELGLAGFALSRYCGLWVGFKLVADVVESSRSVERALAAGFDDAAALDGAAPRFVVPAGFDLPPGGLNSRRSDDRWSQDERTLRFRLPAARAFARANRLDRTVVAPNGRRRIAFVAAGKAYSDLRESFALLGLGVNEMERHGIGLRRIAMVWPLEELDNADFIRDYAEVVVVEEKRAVLEPQLKELAYHWPATRRPRFSGKRDPDGRPLLPEHGELDPRRLAHVVLGRLAAGGVLPAERLEALAARLAPPMPRDPSGARAPLRAPEIVDAPRRTPHFCAGCPHGRSTRLPESSTAMAGIGCHSMAMWMPGSRTSTLCQMGGEGANWIGAAPYVDVPHVFQNLGDGTYAHSGALAIRAAVAAGVPVTYKILVNAASAMTGGQPVEGTPDARRIAWQLHAEGVQPIALVTGRGAAFAGRRADLPPGTWLADRDELDAVMKTFREHRGVSAIVYDQICATEKRRLRKRGERYADEPVVVINERICEGCGDCSAKSNCSAVRRIETAYGPKRRIDESSCNTDLSCLDGFCPSFVTIEHAETQVTTPVPLPRERVAALPEPVRSVPARCDANDANDANDAVAGSNGAAGVEVDRPFGIVLAGVGGSGLVTAGSVLASAALHEGLTVTQLDNTGLARKGGEVSTHLRIAGAAGFAGSTRIPAGCADLLIAGDLGSAASPEVVARLAPGARAVVTDEVAPMLAQAMDPDRPLPVEAYRARLEERTGSDAIVTIAASRIALRTLGDTLYANMILLGAASQSGCLPVSRSALEGAIREHGTAVERNLDAYAWGRLAAADPERVNALLGDAGQSPPADLEGSVAFFADELQRYQDRRLAERYRALVRRVAEAEQRVLGADAGLASAVARNAFDALAIKDEYEVARLASDPDFLAGLAQRYGARCRLVFHFAPAWWPRRATPDGRRAKIRFGPWIVVVLRALHALRGLRGSVLDPFARQAERVAQRRFTEAWCRGVERIALSLDTANLPVALEFARLPESVRGYGHVRTPRLEAASQSMQQLLGAFESRDEAGAAQARR